MNKIGLALLITVVICVVAYVMFYAALWLVVALGPIWFFLLGTAFMLFLVVYLILIVNDA